MFPSIARNRKKVKVGTDQMIKQCEQVFRQVQLRQKKAIRQLPNQLVSDFNKICRLKNISPFYSHYFLYFIQKASKEQVQRNFAQQVESIMLGRSYYQKIHALLQQKDKIVNEIKEQMQTVEGFSIMNSGKNVPHTLKGLINNLIKDCSSLQEVKKIQASQIQKLSKLIVKARDNLKEMIQIIISWQYTLKNFDGVAQISSFKRLKVIYPQNGINCILLSLYDMQFLKSSFLNQQIKFTGVQNDPFILQIESHKKTSKSFNEYFIKTLQTKSHLYKNVQQYINNSIPKKVKQGSQQRQKKNQLKEAYKSSKKFYTSQRTLSQDRKRSQNKIKQQQLVGKKLIMKNQQKNGKSDNLKRKIDIEEIESVYRKRRKQKKLTIFKQFPQNTLNQSKPKKIQLLDNSVQNYLSLTLPKQKNGTVAHERQNLSKKGSLNLQRPKSMSKTSSNLQKIENVYKLSGKSKSVAKIQPKVKQVNSIDLQKILEQKQELAKQLVKQKKQQEMLKKVVKRIENRTASQNRFYQDKIEQYQKQVNLLKSRIKKRQNKYQRMTKSDKQQTSRQKQKINSSISNIYQRKDLNASELVKKDSPQKNLAQAIFQKSKHTNKLLQGKIKQLLKQKTNLQKQIQKQGSKSNKQKQLYERKIQKYQQMVYKIKNQASKNRRQIQQIQQTQKTFRSIGNDKTDKTISNNDKILKLYSKRQNLGVQSNTIKNDPKQMQIVEQRAHQLTRNINKQYIKENQRKVDAKKQVLERTHDLKITNSRNIIEIVYNYKKQQKSSKDTKQQNKQSIIKQKEREHELQMLKLQKQKSLLQRKLQAKLTTKSGAESIMMKKLQQSESQLQKYRQAIQKQKSTQIRYDQRFRQLRKKINQQYEHKIQGQRSRFEQQRQILYIKLKQERQSKIQKDKHLSKQMIFLKEMQMRQNQLLALLQTQKRQRMHKQERLQQQIQNKEQALQQYQIEQIKRLLQKQIREQMSIINDHQDTQSYLSHPIQLQAKKQLMQRQIKQLIQDNDYQLKEMDQQNEKLKLLIMKIKEEEERVLVNLEADIQLQSSRSESRQRGISYNQNQLPLGLTMQRTESARQLPYKTKSQQDLNQFQRNQSLLAELKYKSQVQVQRQTQSHSRYQAIQESTNYKERQRIENVIQMYLKSPHQYPKSKSIVMSKEQKQNLVKDLVYKSKKAQQFQQQLMQLRNMQSFAPAERDDPISNYMPNLRQAYQTQQVQSLRRMLFPAMNQQDKFGQNIHQLSFQSQEFPPVTLMDHLKIHQQQYAEKKKQRGTGKNKNFMAINKIKLLQIQEDKREKQRHLIEQQANKKVKRNKAKSRRKQQKQFQQFVQIKKLIIQKERKRQLLMQSTMNIEQKDQNNNRSDDMVTGNKQIKGQTINQVMQEKDQTKAKEQAQERAESTQTQNKPIFQVDSRQKQQNNDPLYQLNELPNGINDPNSQQVKKDINNQSIEPQMKQNQQQSDYDEQFQDLSSEGQNQFISQQNNTIVEYKQKLAQLDVKQKQIRNGRHVQSEQKEQLSQSLRQNVQQRLALIQRQNSQNIALMLLQQQKSQLKSDLLSYQQQIRSYISQNSQFHVYQHFITEKQLIEYINQVIELSSQQIKMLNNNQTLKKDVLQAECLVILIAKDKQTSLQIGIGIFHKQHQQGQYICDYVVAHNMRNFLNLTFNFAGYIYQNDKHCHATEYIFTLSALKDEVSLSHFNEFQNKCKRLAQIYSKGKQNNTRKYILKRDLFQHIQNQPTTKQHKGIVLNTKVQIHECLLKQRNQGYKNKQSQNFTSPTILLGQYLKNNPEWLQVFRKRVQDDLRNRQTLLTAIMFQKKQFSLKGIQSKVYDTEKRLDIQQNVLRDKFNIGGVQQAIQQLSFKLTGNFTKLFKRCILQIIGQKSEPYSFVQFKQLLTQVQASNSAQIGTFLPLIPKFKILILPAQEFLTSFLSNQDMNVFFYTKHYIKNITQVKKQSYQRVFLPQIKVQGWKLYRNISAKLKKSIFGKEEVQIGFEGKLNNSIIYTPHHKDLVFQKPFIISVLSANVQKIIQGSPIFCKLIQ